MGICRSQVKCKSPSHSKPLISLNAVICPCLLSYRQKKDSACALRAVPIGSANFSLWALGVPAKEMTSLHSFDVSSEMKSAGRIAMRLSNAAEYGWKKIIHHIPVQKVYKRSDGYGRSIKMQILWPRNSTVAPPRVADLLCKRPTDLGARQSGVSSLRLVRPSRSILSDPLFSYSSEQHSA